MKILLLIGIVTGSVIPAWGQVWFQSSQFTIKDSKGQQVLNATLRVCRGTGALFYNSNIKVIEEDCPSENSPKSRLQNPPPMKIPSSSGQTAGGGPYILNPNCPAPCANPTWMVNPNWRPSPGVHSQILQQSRLLQQSQILREPASIPTVQPELKEPGPEVKEAKEIKKESFTIIYDNENPQRKKPAGQFIVPGAEPAATVVTEKCVILKGLWPLTCADGRPAPANAEVPQ